MAISGVSERMRKGCLSENLRIQDMDMDVCAMQLKMARLPQASLYSMQLRHLR
jgi:hypothetical protein